MSTEQYEAIYPIVADHIYQSMNDFDHTIEHISETDSNNRTLYGFVVYDNRTWEGHHFLFTYTGEWLYNHLPLNQQHIQEYNNRIICNAHECSLYNKPLTKENIEMTNIERLKMEVAGVEIPDEELSVYLEEEGLNDVDDYNSFLNSNKKAIYASALSVLHSVANQPHLMKNYKQDDMTISEFAKHLQARINQLEAKVRQMPDQDSSPSNFFNLFNS